MHIPTREELHDAEQELRDTLETLHFESSLKLVKRYSAMSFRTIPPTRVIWAALRVMLNPTPPKDFRVVVAYVVWSRSKISAFSTLPLQLAALHLFGDTSHKYSRDPLFYKDNTLQEHIQRVQRFIPKTAPTLAAYCLTHHNFHHRNALHTWLCTQPGDWSQAHLHVLHTAPSSKSLGQRAILSLLEDTERHTPLTQALNTLSTGNMVQRQLALFGYQRLHNVQALQTMLEQETHEKIRAALQDALTEAQKPRVYDLKSRLGVYTLGEPLDTRAGLSILRELLTQKPSAALWTRICDTLERLRIRGSGEIAASYVQNTLGMWNQDLMVRPHHWENFAPFAELGSNSSEEVWLPIATCAHAHEKKHVTRALQSVQKGTSGKHIRSPDVARFVEYTQHAWKWCLEHAVELEHLRLRVDKTGYTPTYTSSFLAIRHGFGVTLGRAPDVASYPRNTAKDLHFMYAQLERGHPAREKLLMSNRLLKYHLPMP